MMLQRLVVVVGLGAALGAVTPATGDAQGPWTISERNVVTREDLHPAGPPPNPFRHAPDELLVTAR